MENRILAKLPKYAQKAVICLDAYDPRRYGYNRPINYNMYYVDRFGYVGFIDEDGADFIDAVRSLKDSFGDASAYYIPSDYSEGDRLTPTDGGYYL